VVAQTAEAIQSTALPNASPYPELICNRTIDPGRVFDLELPLEQAAEGYRAMDEQRAINTLPRP
jgi:hypothetical protein